MATKPGQPPRIGILAGEMSGDILGAGLMAEIRRRHPDARFEGVGGPRMCAQGMDSRVPMDRLSVMGFVEPLKRLPELLRIRRDLYEHFRDAPPDVFIGVDSPDFCLGLEEKLRALGIPTVHYVSPTVWAWRRRRIRKIARAVDLMLCLFPFEARFYEERDIPVRFTGHPLADEFPEQPDVAGARRELGLRDDDFVLSLLPGSRHNEVARLAPAFLETARLCRQAWPEARILLSAAGSERQAQLEELLASIPDLDLRLVTGRSRQVMAAADLVVLSSGTATLEGLLLKKPLLVCYRMGGFSYGIISRMLKVPYIALPNLLARERLVPEFVQDEVEARNLFAAIRQTRDNPDQLNDLKNRFQAIHRQLKKDASRQAADAVLDLICQKDRD